MKPLSDLRCFIIDMDGVLYRGNLPLPGAQEFLQHLEDRGSPYILATNNSAHTPEQIASRLKEMGMSVPPGRILTSALATAHYLRSLLPTAARVYAIGEEGLYSALMAEGFSIEEGEAEAVVVGIDRGVTYEKLKAATLAIQAGAKFIGTNPDRTFPAEEAIIPGAGAILAAIEAATGMKPTVIGKPEPILFQIALERMEARPEETAIIGDRLETDILGGQRCGLTTILVLTGITAKEEIEARDIKPHYVFPDLRHLQRALTSAGG